MLIRNLFFEAHCDTCQRSFGAQADTPEGMNTLLEKHNWQSLGDNVICDKCWSIYRAVKLARHEVELEECIASALPDQRT